MTLLPNDKGPAMEPADWHVRSKIPAAASDRGAESMKFAALALIVAVAGYRMINGYICIPGVVCL